MSGEPEKWAYMGHDRYAEYCQALRDEFMKHLENTVPPRIQFGKYGHAVREAIWERSNVSIPRDEQRWSTARNRAKRLRQKWRGK